LLEEKFNYFDICYLKTAEYFYINT